VAKPITALFERIPWRWVAPVLLIAISIIRTAEDATAFNVTGILIGVVWLVVALRSGVDEPRFRREDGLTPAMASGLKRALASRGQGASAPDQKGASPAADPAMQAMDRAIAEQRKTDPLIKVKLGGNEVFQRMVAGLKAERGVHIESLLALLGALAGYACQFSVRERNIKYGAKSPVSGLTVATGADGRKYYFGDALNKPLAEDRYSVWSLTAGTVQQLRSPLPDLAGIFKHAAATVGGAEFGIPRLPEGHRAGDLPINYLTALWPKLLPIVQRFCEEPAHVPMVFAIAIQKAILMGKDVIDPTLAGTIVMECAVPMSKVDLG
jgi:hypothetical protein